ncbi:MAG: segregation/condensation protein A, partial [Halioglobus sp.]
MSANESNSGTPDAPQGATPENTPAAPDQAAAAAVSAPLEPQPQQGEMPFAVVMGQAVTELPKDLYIPPEALEVFLETF